MPSCSGSVVDLIWLTIMVNDNVYTVHEELPDEFIISVDDTVSALR